MISKEKYALLYKEHTKGRTIKELSVKYNIRYSTLYYGLRRNGYMLEKLSLGIDRGIGLTETISKL